MNFYFILKHKVTLFYLLSFVFIRFITCPHSLLLIDIFCHSLSFLVNRCHTLSLVLTVCHSLYYLLSLVVPLVVTPCHSLYQSLSLVVIRCHSLYHSFSLVVTRCITRLSFCKYSQAVRCHNDGDFTE